MKNGFTVCTPLIYAPSLLATEATNLLRLAKRLHIIGHLDFEEELLLSYALVRFEFRQVRLPRSPRPNTQ